MPAFCPLCALEDYASEQRTEDGRVFAVCSAKEHGPDGHVWEPTVEGGRRGRSDGLGARLDIWDKLLESVPSDGAVHSYGEVEEILFERYPSDAHLLQERYGHRWREGKKPVNQYSMSVYLALRLSELAKEGLLDLTWGPAEGEWAYNSTISHWRRV